MSFAISSLKLKMIKTRIKKLKETKINIVKRKLEKFSLFISKKFLSNILNNPTFDIPEMKVPKNIDNANSPKASIFKYWENNGRVTRGKKALITKEKQYQNKFIVVLFIIIFGEKIIYIRF